MNELILVQELKDILNITWEEEETDRKLERIIDDSKNILDWKLGYKVDYSIAGQEHNLFLNYCMYAYNNCTNEFDDNYLNEIMQIRQKYEVLAYEQEVEV